MYFNEAAFCGALGADSDRYALVWNGGFGLDPEDIDAIPDPTIRRQAIEEYNRNNPGTFILVSTGLPPQPGVPPPIVDYRLRSPEERRETQTDIQQDRDMERARDYSPSDTLSPEEQAERRLQVADFLLKGGDPGAATTQAEQANTLAEQALAEEREKQAGASLIPVWAIPVAAIVVGIVIWKGL